MNNLSNTEIQLRNGAIAPLFRKYAIPGVITLLFIGLQTIIDGVIIGNFVGANALASISLVLPCYSFMAAVSVVIGVGCQALISIRLGEQNKKGANDALKSAFLFLIGFSVTISTTIYLLAPQIATLLGSDEALLSNAVDYLRALAMFFPFIIIMFFSDYVIKAMGRPVYSMTIMSSTVILNIILDILFVIAWDMGTYGAGLATGIAFTVGAIFNVPVMLSSGNILKLTEGKFSWRLVWQMMYNGSSEGMSELSSGISTLLFNLALMHYIGASGVAAFTAINYVFFIGITIFLGVSDGIIPIVSYNYGANQWQRIKQVFTLAIKSNFTIGLILFLALTFFGEQIISLFFSSDEGGVMEIASAGTRIYAFAFLINGLNILSASFFTALGNAKISIIISALRGLVFVVIGIWLFPMILGIEGIWYAVPVAEVCTLSISYLLVRRAFKK